MNEWFSLVELGGIPGVTAVNLVRQWWVVAQEQDEASRREF